MPRIELPPEAGTLSAQERRAVVVALERALARGRSRPSPWALAGRAQATRRGLLPIRREAVPAWRLRGHVPFARRGTPPLVGRGDAK
jgi:hypothetical protein